MRRVTRVALRNYLRVRGEYHRPPREPGYCGELPPRARRIRYSSGIAAAIGGTTSACAENTDPPRQSFHKPRNYLRVRGEYSLDTQVDAESWELPPRARRILAVNQIAASIAGTTSACAENTVRKTERRPSSWNYLRVRGEYLFLR